MAPAPARDFTDLADYPQSAKALGIRAGMDFALAGGARICFLPGLAGLAAKSPGERCDAIPPPALRATCPAGKEEKDAVSPNASLSVA